MITTNKPVSTLTSIQKGRVLKAPRILIYGTEGVGKSTFAAGAANPVFIQAEDGLDVIGADRYPLAPDFQTVLDQLDDLIQKQEYQTLAIDTMDGLEKIILEQMKKDYNVKDYTAIGGGYSKYQEISLIYWDKIKKRLTVLRDRGMVIALIAHAEIRTYNDPESRSYDRYSPRLVKPATAMFCEWCDVIAFAKHCKTIEKEDLGFGKTRSIAVETVNTAGSSRTLQCYPSPACVAKNRYGIECDLPLEWNAMIQAITKQGDENAKADHCE